MVNKYTGQLFNIVYADPPWYFHTYSEKGRNRSPKYKVMNTSDIKVLRINDISAPNSVLFMWATYPMLERAFQVIEAWGFEYRTVAFTWVKQNKVTDTFFTGLGYYTRANPEICLLGIKGKPLPRQSKSVLNLVISRIGKHSTKPPELRDRIIELFGDLPRVELFARERVEGWDGWGAEYPKE